MIEDRGSSFSPSPSHIVLFRGQQGGTYGFAEIVESLPSPATGSLSSRGLQSADLDADGDLDLVALSSASTSSGEAWVLLNDGSGGFGSPMSIGPTGGSSSQIQIDDFNQDGLVDIAIGSSFTMASGIHFGLGQGAFAPRVDLVEGGIEARGLLLVDFDGDGDLDAVVGSPEAPGLVAPQSTYFFENQNGFPIAVSEGVDIGRDVNRLAVGDVDGDGDADIVATNRNDFGLVVWFERLPSGGFGPEATLASLSQAIDTLTIADADADGDLDLLMRSGNAVTIAENLGAGAFGPRRTVLDTTSLESVTVGDENGDGLPDLIVTAATTTRGRLDLFRGGLDSAADYEVGLPMHLIERPLGGPSVGSAGRLVPIDVDGDGADEFLGLGSQTGVPQGEAEIILKRRDSSGAWPRGEIVARGPVGFAEPVVADFNGDGLEDFASRPGSLNLLEVYLSDGNGGFAPPHSVTLPGPGPRLAAADLNGDAYADLVFTLGASTSVGFALGAPGPGFASFGSIVGGFASEVNPLPVDLDGDGRDDLVYVVPNALEVSRNTGNGAFDARVVLTAFPNNGTTVATRPRPSDIDGDGRVDLVLTGIFNGQGQALLMRNVGGGAVAAPTPLLPGLTNVPQLIDVDADGLPDMVRRQGPTSFGPFEWARNEGALAFGPFTAIQDTEGTEFLTTVPADPDGDGDEDLLIRINNGGVAFLENTTLGPVGMPFCGPGVPNSTGAAGQVLALGSIDLGANQFRLRAEFLPPESFGFFFVSSDAAFVTTVPNSIGTLCLGGSIGRFNLPGQIFQVAASGAAAVPVDLGAIPSPTLGSVPALPGDTWHFQAWHRDTTASGTATSNFTEAVRVDF